MDLDELPPLLKPKEVAQFLRITPLTVGRMEKRGELFSIRINSRGDRRFKREDMLKIYNQGV